MLYPIELRAPTPVITAEAALGVRDDALNGASFCSPGNYPPPKTPSRQTTARGANPAAHRAQATHVKKPQRKPRPDGRYKTRTCDLHDVNVAL
jgi:hypothetical protein